MRCNFCGMELPYRQYVCTNCGAQNQKEVKEQRTGSVLKVITVVVRVLAAVFFIVGISLNNYEAQPKEMKMRSGEIATMMQSYVEDHDFLYYETWRETAAEFIDDYDSGNSLSYYGMEYLVRYGHQAMHDEDLPKEYRDQVALELETILLDIIGVKEEEYALIFETDPEYTYSVRMPEEAIDTLAEAMARELRIER